MTFRIKNILAASLAMVCTVVGVSAQVTSGLGSLPLYFEAQGSVDASQFLARSRDGQVLISAAGAQLTLRSGTTVHAQFLGASPQSHIQGEAELAGRINYLNGSDPSRWRTGLPTYAKVRIENLYPGVDAVYYGNQQQLEYDLNVAAGVSPEQIAIHFDGVDKMSIDDQGKLALFARQGEMDQAKPVIYQMVSGERREISGGYKIVGAQTVAFTVGRYDHRLPLVIDPILSYSTYIGGISGTTGYAIAINTNDGDIFVAGDTLSTKLASTNAFQTNFNGGSFLGDAFVAKFDQNFNLLYWTYLGGSADDVALSIAVDSAENVFVGGFTTSPDFPVTTNTVTGIKGVPGITNHIGGSVYSYSGYYPEDGFVTELGSGGSNLVYSTYLGGNNEDAVYALAIDGADNVYVTGYSGSTNMPVKNPVPFRLKGSTNNFLSSLACSNTYANCNAFIARISSHGTNLDFLTYLGGNNLDFGRGIALDSANNVFVTGYTTSTNFPITNAFQVYLNQSSNLILNSDAFVAKFAQTPTNLNLIYSTFLGNTNSDVAISIAIDSQNAAYVTGWTTSTNFPNNRRATISCGVTNNVNFAILTTNVFLTKITNNVNNAALTNTAGIEYSVVFGGLLADVGYAVAVDPAGEAFVTGSSTSPLFPTKNTLGLLRYTNSGGNDVFVTAFDANCSNVLYSVLLGGKTDDAGYGIAVDSASTAYVVGHASSTNFPVTTASTNFPIYSAMSKSLSGTNDAFLAKILINQFELPLAITADTTRGVWETKTNPPTYNTNTVINQVTLAWQTHAEPEIGSFALESITNLAMTNWQLVSTAPTLINNTNFVTLPTTNKYRFFRLIQ